MKRRGIWAALVAAVAGASAVNAGHNEDPQTKRIKKSKGGGHGRGAIPKAGRPLPTGTLVGNNPWILKNTPFAWVDNWHASNRAGHRGPRGTGHARRKCWR